MTVTPNLEDYARARATFTWTRFSASSGRCRVAIVGFDRTVHALARVAPEIRGRTLPRDPSLRDTQRGFSAD